MSTGCSHHPESTCPRFPEPCSARRSTPLTRANRQIRNHGGMKVPPMADVQALAEQYGARQIVVLLFNGESYIAKSYGATKAECASVGRTLDAIADKLKRGEIVSP